MDLQVRKGLCRWRGESDPPPGLGCKSAAADSRTEGQCSLGGGYIAQELALPARGVGQPAGQQLLLLLLTALALHLHCRASSRREALQTLARAHPSRGRGKKTLGQGEPETAPAGELAAATAERARTPTRREAFCRSRRQPRMAGRRGVAMARAPASFPAVHTGRHHLGFKANVLWAGRTEIKLHFWPMPCAH